MEKLSLNYPFYSLLSVAPILASSTSVFVCTEAILIIFALYNWTRQHFLTIEAQHLCLQNFKKNVFVASKLYC